MDKITSADRQRIYRIAAIACMVLIMTVMVASMLQTYLETRLRDVLLGPYAQKASEYGYTVDYETIQLKPFSSVVLKDLRINGAVQEESILQISEFRINYRLGELLSGKKGYQK